MNIELNKIYQGDSLQVLKTFPDKCIDMVFTDPPYNEKYNYRNSGFIDYRDDYYEFLRSVLWQCRRVLKDSGSIYLKHSSRQVPVILQMICSLFNFKSLIIWISNSQSHPSDNYDSYYEPIYFATKTDDYYFDKKAELRKEPPGYWSGEGKEFVGLLTNCWYDIKKELAGCLRPEGERIGKEKFHPCSMPIRLPQRAIRVSCPVSGIVLDPFAGSGATCIAAKIDNRQYIGIEIEQPYRELAERRLHNEAGLL